MLNSNINASGALKVAVYRNNKNTPEVHEFKNLVVDAGLALVASRLVGDMSAVPSHMAVGAGTAQQTAGDTTLIDELGRVELDSITLTGTGGIVFTSIFSPGTGTGSITEAGLFNSSSSGDMLCRTTFDAISKSVDDAMVITWDLTFSAV